MKKLLPKAHTMLELVVCIAVIGVLVLAISSVFDVGDSTWRNEMAMLSLQQDVRLAVDGMSRELRASDASNITISAGGAQIDFYVPSSSNVITYYLSGTQLIREHPANTTKIIAKNISALSFSLSGEVVTMQITGATVSKGRPLNFTLSEEIKLRND